MKKILGVCPSSGEVEKIPKFVRPIALQNNVLKNNSWVHRVSKKKTSLVFLWIIKCYLPIKPPNNAMPSQKILILLSLRLPPKNIHPLLLHSQIQMRVSKITFYFCLLLATLFFFPKPVQRWMTQQMVR